jgi:catechol 2,3-dioxygenase-like lactoylglutathione lyase family enzyme
MNDAQIHHTGFTVSDLERALRFWRDGLGAEVVLDQTSQGTYLGAIIGQPGARGHAVHLRLPGGEQRIELYHYLDPVGGTGEELRPIDAGFAHVAVACSDLRGLLARLVAAGGRPYGEPVRIDAGVNAGALGVYVRDPDGHTLELIQPASR